LIDLTGKVCVVAGASGVIGTSVAVRLQREGAQTALTYHSSTPLDRAGDSEIANRRLAWFKLDVTDYGEVARVIADIEHSFGRIDVLVNCTGVVGPIGPLETLDVRQWSRTIETNLIGSVHLAHAVVPIMKKTGSGKIILFSGGGAAYGRPFFTSYASSKAAVVRFTESLAQELAPYNIQVNAVAPGAVRSGMWTEMRAAAPVGGPGLLKELENMDDTGGVTPERAAGITAFLASDRSSKLTGRLLSAIWDDWEQLDDQSIKKIAMSDAWMLRRMPVA